MRSGPTTPGLFVGGATLLALALGAWWLGFGTFGSGAPPAALQGSSGPPAPEEGPDEAAARRETGRGAASPAEAQPSAPPALDPRIAAELAHDGVVEVRVLDEAGRPVAGLPVCGVPEATWRWLLGGPEERARLYLENLATTRAAEVVRTDESGSARLVGLAREGPQRVLSGGGAWLSAASAGFASGSTEVPAAVELRLARRAQIEVSVRGDEGKLLPLLAARVLAGEGEEPFSSQPLDPSAARTAPLRRLLGPVAAGQSCRIEATVLVARGTQVLRGEVLPEFGRVVALELTLAEPGEEARSAVLPAPETRR